MPGNVNVLKAQEFLKSDQGKMVMLILATLILAGVTFTITMWLTTPRKAGVVSKPVSKPVILPPPSVPSTSVETEKGAETFEIYQSKDPFEPLISQAPAAPAQPGTAAPSESTAPTSPVVGRNQITLLEIFTENNVKFASIQVGSTVYKVKEGEGFATNYKLVSIGSDSVTLLYGDDSATLKIGETIFK